MFEGYTNSGAVSISRFDVILDFATTSPDRQTTSLEPEDIIARIRMSPHYFKVLTMTMQERLRQYEEAFGVINTNVNPAVLPTPTDAPAN